MLIAETVLVAQVIEGVAGADLIGLLAQQLQAAAHLHPMVEGASQGDRGHMRGMEDTALVWRGFNFDTGPVLFKVRLFPNLYRRRKACKWDARPDLHGDGDAVGLRGGRSHHASRQGAGGTPAVMLGHDSPHMSSPRRRAHGDFSCAAQLKAFAWVARRRSRLESVAARRQYGVMGAAVSNRRVPVYR